MPKILTVSQIREWDQYTIQHEPIESINLMERAAKAFAVWYTNNFSQEYHVGVICGMGNNGGDGLVIARLLHDWGYPVSVWIVNGGSESSDDFKINLKRLPSPILAGEITQTPVAEIFDGCHILIDALFGSGLSRPIQGVFAEVVERINETSVPTLSVDMPSGLFADKPSEGRIIKAEKTITFQLPKLSFFLPQSADYVGSWSVIDIGLNKEFLDQAPTLTYYVKSKEIQQIIKQRSRFSHKGTYGKALLIAGSVGKMGASILAAKATLRAGVGLLTIHTPVKGYIIIQTAVPEAMAQLDENESYFTACTSVKDYDVIGIGPGLGMNPATQQAFLTLLQENSNPMVIDADGLNILSQHPDWLHHLPPGSILTPHPKEFERLVGEWANDFEKLEKLRSLASTHNIIVILKGAFTAVASSTGEIYFNSTGNPGMATGGSGDVLTGILTGLMAQKYSALETAILGVYLHGLAGDLAAKEIGMEAMIASDIIKFLPAAFKKVHAQMEK